MTTCPICQGSNDAAAVDCIYCGNRLQQPKGILSRILDSLFGSNPATTDLLTASENTDLDRIEVDVSPRDESATSEPASSVESRFEGALEEFEMQINEVFEMEGTGTLVVGVITRGVIHKGDRILIQGLNGHWEDQVMDIDTWATPTSESVGVSQATTGDEVGLLLSNRDTKHYENLELGAIISALR